MLLLRLINMDINPSCTNCRHELCNWQEKKTSIFSFLYLYCYQLRNRFMCFYYLSLLMSNQTISLKGKKYKAQYAFKSASTDIAVEKELFCSQDNMPLGCLSCVLREPHKNGMCGWLYRGRPRTNQLCVCVTMCTFIDFMHTYP